MQTPMNDDAASTFRAPDTRTDVHRCRIVDAAIALQGSSSTMSAVEYLRGSGVGASVIVRVLLEPQRRRPR